MGTVSCVLPPCEASPRPSPTKSVSHDQWMPYQPSSGTVPRGADIRLTCSSLPPPLCHDSSPNSLHRPCHSPYVQHGIEPARVTTCDRQDPRVSALCAARTAF